LQSNELSPKAAEWSKTVSVKMKGSSNVVLRPGRNGCKACYDWYDVQLKCLKTWEEHVADMQRKEYKQDQSMAEQVALGKRTPAHDREGVASVNGSFKTWRRVWQAATETQIKALANKRYLSKKLLEALPQEYAPKEGCPGETELVYLFLSEEFPYRLCLVDTKEGEERNCLRLAPENHLWPSKAIDVQAKCRKLRNDAEAGTTNARTLKDWLVENKLAGNLSVGPSPLPASAVQEPRPEVVPLENDELPSSQEVVLADESVAVAKFSSPIATSKVHAGRPSGSGSAGTTPVPLRRVRQKTGASPNPGSSVGEVCIGDEKDGEDDDDDDRLSSASHDRNDFDDDFGYGTNQNFIGPTLII